MSNVPAPSPLTHLVEEIEPTSITRLPDPPEVQPLTDFELEVRQRLANIESHLARTDSILMQVQLDERIARRQLLARVDARIGEIAKGLAEMMPLLKHLAGNGHG